MNRQAQQAAASAGLLEVAEADRNKRNREEIHYKGNFTPYDLRHTCASLKLRAGMPPATIAKEMGHSIETRLPFLDYRVVEAPKMIEGAYVAEDAPGVLVQPAPRTRDQLDRGEWEPRDARGRPLRGSPPRRRRRRCHRR